jgi:hypothetical protein
VWLYTGSWCVDDNVWDAAMEAAGNVINCWWQCEVDIHQCVGGQVVVVTEIISGSWSVITSRIPKTAQEMEWALNPNDKYKGALRDILRRVGYTEGNFSRHMTRGAGKIVMVAGKRIFATTMFFESGVSVYCGYKCSY